VYTPSEGDAGMTLTLSRSPAVRSRSVAATELQAAPVETLGRPRRIGAGLAPRQEREARATRPPIDIVEEWGLQSFPASDPPPNW
jgi:hypothetical protein